MAIQNSIGSKITRWLQTLESFNLCFEQEILKENIEREMSFAEKTISSSNPIHLISVTLDKNINFKSHIENMFCKANNK